METTVAYTNIGNSAVIPTAGARRSVKAAPATKDRKGKKPLRFRKLKGFKELVPDPFDLEP